MNTQYLLATVMALIVVSSEAAQHYRGYPAWHVQECKIKSHGLKTINDVQDAIDKAKEGDIIRLDPIDYTGNLKFLGKNNRKYISIIGDNQCHKNTVIRGELSIRGNNLIVSAIIFEKSDNAINVLKSENVKLMNLVINEINGKAISVKESNDVQIDNLVVENIGNNALDFSYSGEIRVRNAVISNIAGIAMSFDNSFQIKLYNNVFRNVVKEVIKTSGHTSNVKISQSVINANSEKGQGWMSLEGDHFKITNMVATGSPRNGIMVYGCHYTFSGNICTMGTGGYCIYLNNQAKDCRHDIGRTNMIVGGRGLHNKN